MSANLEMAQYLDLFLQESEEQIAILEQETLKLEQDPTPERLQIIFRAAHTLKGSSRAMGFSNLAQITHEMENVLDSLRQGKLQVTTEIADALLGCMDTLFAMHESIAGGQSDSVAIESQVQALQAITSQTAEAPTPASLKTEQRLPDDVVAALNAAGQQSPILHAKFKLSQDCVMKYVRAFMAISVLQEDGELLASIPSSEDLEEERFEQEFELFVQNSQPIEALRAKLAEVGEMDAFDIALWTEGVRETEPGPASTDERPTPSEPAKAQEQSTAAQPGRKAESGQTVRVDVTRMDALMNLVGELVIDRTRLAQIGAELSSKVNDSNVDALAETVGHIARITSDLQDQIMKARMMPIDVVFNRFPRVVRDLAHKLGKDIRIDIAGSDTDLDRSVIEIIGDPLLHIIRNSIDHGIELPDDREKVGKPRQGVIAVTARHQDNCIMIEVIDDGRGIDVEKIKAKAIANGLTTAEQASRLAEREILHFIFASGLSTAEEVSEVSGRGVGMDIVRSNIQKLGGMIDIETTLGEGSKFVLRLPLTLAIIRGLLVSIGGVVYAIPLGSVVETLRIEETDIQWVCGREVVLVRGLATPIVRMRKAFASREFTPAPTGSLHVVIVGLAEKRMGLVVDHLIGEQEVVLKSLSRYCGDVQGVSGATILGNGRVALILDINGVINV